MNALTVRDLTKTYPGFKLDGVSFTVGQGRIVGLIGANGAGKSTTLKGILRLISATGEVSVYGKDMHAEEFAAKQLIGYAGGGFRFYPMKRLDAIRKAYAAFFPAWDQEKYERYLARFDLSEEKRGKELSDGMKVKFAVALAVSHGAKLLIMDEPTSGLDPLSREEFCDHILGLVRNEGISVLFSTHITSDLMRIADDVVYLSRGKVLADCPLEQLLSRYRVVRFGARGQAEAARAIGIKAVKNGYEGLLERGNAVPDGASAEDATLDSVMIHLEIAGREGEKCGN